MAVEDEDLITGKKSILDIKELKVITTDWQTVIRIKKKDRTFPVNKVGGRWCTRRSLIVQWLENRLTAGIGA